MKRRSAIVELGLVILILPVGTRTLAFEHHEDRMPTPGYEPTRQAAIAAFAKRWRRE
jgi:hypothetical protein